MKIAVIGGGISGLTAAHRIVERLPLAELTLFEASNRLGGVLETVRDGDFLIERSADSFVTKPPRALDLCQRIGFADYLIPTDESKRRAMVVSRGRLQPVPAGFVIMSPGRVWPILTTPILSWPGKLRLLAERFVRKRRAVDHDTDESVESFAMRRLGREAYERLVQPLLAGIYTADATRLSMAATMPQILSIERDHGSLWSRPLAKTESGARYGMFVAPREGMTSLVSAIAARLPASSVRLNAVVERLQFHENRWTLHLTDTKEQFEFDAVIVALPAHAAAEVIRNFDAELSRELGSIEYAGCAVVSLVYQNSQFSRPLEGFGFVVPRIEDRPIIAASYASEKFAGRTPHDASLIRVFLGGALQPQMLERSDVELRGIAHEQLVDLLGIVGQPVRSDVARWPRSMPQYHVGHLERVARIFDLVEKWPGITVAGNAYRGVGIPQCVLSGETAAGFVMEYLGQKK
jgi:protoporphyrinogen/coproporphyrinogen III oxidase